MDKNLFKSIKALLSSALETSHSLRSSTALAWHFASEFSNLSLEEDVTTQEEKITEHVSSHPPNSGKVDEASHENATLISEITHSELAINCENVQNISKQSSEKSIEEVSLFNIQNIDPVSSQNPPTCVKHLNGTKQNYCERKTTALDEAQTKYSEAEQLNGFNPTGFHVELGRTTPPKTSNTSNKNADSSQVDLQFDSDNVQNISNQSNVKQTEEESLFIIANIMPLTSQNSPTRVKNLNGSKRKRESESTTPSDKVSTKYFKADKSPYKCDHCDYRSTRCGDLQRHQRTHTGEKPYKCHHTDPPNLEKVDGTSHENDTFISDSTCKELPFNPDNLENISKGIDEKQIEEEPVLIIEHIDKLTSQSPPARETNLNRTKRKRHSESTTPSEEAPTKYSKADNSSYKCGHCNHRFSQSSDLRRHERTHTEEKPYKCHHCDYRSTRGDHLRIHERTHTGEKPYKCDHCDYKSAQSSVMRSHKLTHTGEKPYKCDHCDFSSIRRYHLRIHERTHTGEKPYKCDHCDYRSSQIGNLKKHETTHTGDKPYECGQCDYRSNQRTHLRKHERIHTAENNTRGGTSLT